MTALVAGGLAGAAVPAATLIVIASVALALDAVDGRVARRTGTASALGARFDMEVDAFLVLVLSVYVATLVGPWALVIGAMRYAFVVASWALPWMRASLPTRYRREGRRGGARDRPARGVVAAAAAPGTAALVGAALGALSWSFGCSVAWLWRHARA